MGGRECGGEIGAETRAGSEIFAGWRREICGWTEVGGTKNRSVWCKVKVDRMRVESMVEKQGGSGSGRRVGVWNSREYEVCCRVGEKDKAQFTQDTEQIIRNTLWSMGVFTQLASKQHQRVCTQICVQMYLPVRILCEWALRTCVVGMQCKDWNLVQREGKDCWIGGG